MYPAGYFVHLLFVIGRQRDLRIEDLLRPLGVSLAAQRVLRAVRRYGSVTMGELADFAIIDRTTLTRIVDQLVAKGFIERSKPASDRRKVTLTLTEAGEEAHAAMVRVISRDNDDLLRDLPEKDLRTAVRLQQRIVTRLVGDEQLLRRLLWLE